MDTVLGAGVQGTTDCAYVFAAVARPQDLVASARGGIVADGLLHDVPLPRRAGLQRAAQRFLVDFKMLHLGVQRYLLPRVRDRERRTAAVAHREERVDPDYQAHARRIDQDHSGVPADAVREGRVPAGPVLALLRTFAPVGGLVFGGYAEASPAVHSLHREAVRRASAGWRALGCRSEAEARSVLAHMFARDWGLGAARAAAHPCARVLRAPAAAPRFHQVGCRTRRPRRQVASVALRPKKPSARTHTFAAAITSGTTFALILRGLQPPWRASSRR